MPDKRIMTNQMTNFLNISIFKGTATFPQTMSSGSGALDATISAY